MSWTQKQRAAIISHAYKPVVPHGKSALDAGCGNGIVTKCLGDELGLKIIGADIIDYRGSDIDFRLMHSPDIFPFENDSVDFVMFNCVLHHMENVEAILTDAKRVAKEGVLVFEDIESLLLTIVDKGLNYYYCPNMPCPLTFRSDKEWRNLFKTLGFTYDILSPKYPFWYPFKHMAYMLNKQQ